MWMKGLVNLTNGIVMPIGEAWKLENYPGCPDNSILKVNAFGFLSLVQPMSLNLTNTSCVAVHKQLSLIVI